MTNKLSSLFYSNIETIMQARDYFPLGIAKNLAFCNRVQETRLITENMKNGKHMLILSPRRQGKTSLSLHALRQGKLPYTEIDFYLATKESAIERYFLNGISELIGKVLGPIDKLLNQIKTYLKNLTPKIAIGTDSLQLELTSNPDSDPANNIKEGLLLLEKLLEKNQKTAVMLLDEFQTIGVIAQGTGIEGAIRHVAQKTKYLTFIFSGSHRRMLKTMFENESRPLYKLCWKLNLQRIHADDYKKHIKKAAQLNWNQKLDNFSLENIITLSERHPHYLNKLCDRLLTYYPEFPPSAEEIKIAWEGILEEEKSDAIKEIFYLPTGQKTLLKLIAQGKTTHLTNKEVIFESQMTSSAIVASLDKLEEKDIIEKIEQNYQIINPVIKYYASL